MFNLYYFVACDWYGIVWFDRHKLWCECIKISSDYRLSSARIVELMHCLDSTTLCAHHNDALVYHLINVARRDFCPSVRSMPCTAVSGRRQYLCCFIFSGLKILFHDPRLAFLIRVWHSFFLIFNLKDLTLEIDNVSNIFFDLSATQS